MRAGRAAFAIALIGAGLFTARCDKESPIEPTPDCSAVLLPTVFSFDAPGGTGSVGLDIGSGCRWTSQSSAAWVTFTSPTAGTGSATLAFSVSPNLDEADRSATLTIAEKAVSILERGKPVEPPATCSYDVRPLEATYSRSGGPGTLAVTASVGCPWTATSDVSWATITTGPRGSGTGSVAYVVDANTETSPRVGHLVVAGREVTVAQAGDLEACTYAVSPVEFSPCVGAVEMSTTLTTQASCPWNASPNAGWIALASSGSGLGSAVIRFTASSNFDAPRFGQVLVRWPTATAGQNLRVSQAGCHYAVSRSTFTLPAAGGTFTFDVVQETEPNTCGGPLQNACQWSAVSDAGWVSVVSSMPRVGDDRVSFLVMPNTTPAARSATIVVRDQVVRITQAGQ